MFTCEGVRLSYHIPRSEKERKRESIRNHQSRERERSASPPAQIPMQPLSPNDPAFYTPNEPPFDQTSDAPNDATEPRSLKRKSLSTQEDEPDYVMVSRTSSMCSTPPRKRLALRTPSPEPPADSPSPAPSSTSDSNPNTHPLDTVEEAIARTEETVGVTEDMIVGVDLPQQRDEKVDEEEGEIVIVPSNQEPETQSGVCPNPLPPLNDFTPPHRRFYMNQVPPAPTLAEPITISQPATSLGP
ncbi:hypothetical protein JAAARDRAFT_150185, partial [Jaapia argillacea MUCL 33604]